MAYSSNYLCIADILVTSDKVPCKFLSDLPRMGFLNPANKDEDIKAGSNLDLPLWLAEPLCSRRPPLVTIDLPKFYREYYREILRANATTVDLYKLGQFFYEFGCYITKYDIKGEVADSLISTFRDRFKMILAASENTDTMTAIQYLSMSERDRATSAIESERALQDWLKSGECKLKTAPMVSNHRKRKRAELEIL